MRSSLLEKDENMKHSSQQILKKDAFHVQSTLSKEAVDLMDSILASWRQLDELVQVEWKAVLKGEFIKLYRFARAKEILSDHIEAYEKRLRDIFCDMLCALSGKAPKGSITAAVLQALPFEERRYLMDFHAERANLKIRVAFTNRRTMMWVRERMDFTNELVDILTGKKLRKSATYCPPGRSFIYRKSPGFEILNKGTADTGNNTKTIGTGHGSKAVSAYSDMQTRR